MHLFLLLRSRDYAQSPWRPKRAAHGLWLKEEEKKQKPINTFSHRHSRSTGPTVRLSILCRTRRQVGRRLLCLPKQAGAIPCSANERELTDNPVRMTGTG